MLSAPPRRDLDELNQGSIHRYEQTMEPAVMSRSAAPDYIEAPGQQRRYFLSQDLAPGHTTDELGTSETLRKVRRGHEGGWLREQPHWRNTNSTSLISSQQR